jgi:DNA-binding protein YbaB
VKIDPKVVDPKDVEMLEDLILGAVTNALQAAKKTQEEELGKVTAGMNLPGMM